MPPPSAMSIASFFKPREPSGSSKRPREENERPKAHVRTIVSWNANSLINRINSDRAELQRFVCAHVPDVIFISEVRSPAHGPANCKKGDRLPRQQGKLSRATPALDKEAEVIAAWCREHGYRSYWSLAEYKYAGCGLLVRTTCDQPRTLRYSMDTDGPADRCALLHHVAFQNMMSGCGFWLHHTHSICGVQSTSVSKKRQL